MDPLPAPSPARPLPTPSPDAPPQAIRPRTPRRAAPRLLLPLAFLLAVPCAAQAGERRPRRASPRPPPSPSRSRSVNTGAISADIHFIASDQMRGRYTPSPEIQIVARYLRARLQRLGFEPGAGADFLFEYDLDHKAIDPSHTVVKLTGPSGTPGATMAFGEDFFYSRGNLGEDGDSAGRSSTAAAAPRKSSKGSSSGRWALVVDDGESRSSYRTLRSTEALGMIEVASDDYAGEPYPERFKVSTERLVEGSYAYGPPRGGNRRMSPFSQLYLSAAAAARLGLVEGLASGTKLPFTITEERRLLGGGDGKVTVENVCGLWPGCDPELSKEVIIVSGTTTTSAWQGRRDLQRRRRQRLGHERLAGDRRGPGGSRAVRCGARSSP